MTDKQIIIDDCIHLNEWKHCDICEKLIKTKDGANGKKRKHLLTEEDLRCDFYPNCYYKQLKRKEQECKNNKIAHQMELDIYNQECLNLQEELKTKEQECEELKAEIKLSKEILIQNTSETNKYTIPQIIEQFISDNYIDQQNEDGYTIPVFIQIENILDIKEDLEQQLDRYSQTLTEIKEIAEKRNYLDYKECLDDILQKISEVK